MYNLLIIHTILEDKMYMLILTYFHRWAFSVSTSNIAVSHTLFNWNSTLNVLIFGAKGASRETFRVFRTFMKTGLISSLCVMC